MDAIVHVNSSAQLYDAVAMDSVQHILVAPGRYVLTRQTCPASTNTLCALYIDRNLSLASESAEVQPVLDAASAGHRVLLVDGGNVHVRLDGLNITGGVDLSAFGSGGGLLLRSSTPTARMTGSTVFARNCNFYENAAYRWGGAIENFNANLEIVGGSISSNVVGLPNNSEQLRRRHRLLALPALLTPAPPGISFRQSAQDGQSCHPEAHCGAGGGLATSSGSVTTLRGVHIHHNRLYGSTISNYGAGVSNFEGSLRMFNCTISDNVAIGGDAGGVYNGRGNASLLNCTLISNVARARFFGPDDCTLGTNCTYGLGGAIKHFRGLMTLRHCRLSYNVAEDVAERNGSHGQGGAIWAGLSAGMGKLVIVNSVIDHNRASGRGGAIDNWMQLVLRRTLLTHNRAASGGGIHHAASTCELNASNVRDNSADDAGGGLLIDGGVVIANEQTNISGNSAPEGSGRQVLQSSNSFIYQLPAIRGRYMYSAYWCHTRTGCHTTDNCSHTISGICPTACPQSCDTARFNNTWLANLTLVTDQDVPFECDYDYYCPDGIDRRFCGSDMVISLDNSSCDTCPASRCAGGAVVCSRFARPQEDIVRATTVAQCECVPGYFRLNRSTEECLHCPLGAECPRNRTGEVASTLLVRPGFWRLSNRTPDIRPCPVRAACIGDSDVRPGSYCQPGVDPVVPYCSRCLNDSEYLDRTTGACKACTASHLSAVVLGSFVILVLSSVAVCRRWKRSQCTQVLPKQPFLMLRRQVPKMKLVLGYYQIVGHLEQVFGVSLPSSFTVFTQTTCALGPSSHTLAHSRTCINSPLFNYLPACASFSGAFSAMATH